MKTTLLIMLMVALCSSCMTLRYSEEDLANMSPPTDEEITSLIRRLNAGLTVPNRVKAAQRLALSRDPRVGEALAGYLNTHNEVQVSHEIRRILQEKRYPSAVPNLLQALRHSEWQIVQIASWLLGTHREQQSVEALVRNLNHKRWRIRLAAVWALGEIGSEAAVQPLCRRLLKDRKATVRLTAAQALGKIGDVQAIPFLAERLDRDWPCNGSDKPGIMWGSSMTYALSCCDAPPYNTCQAAVLSSLRILARCTDAGVDLFLNEARTRGHEFVVGTYEILMYLGRDETVPLLLDAFNKDPTEQMAEDFSRCRNRELAKAGEEWLQATRFRRGVAKFVEGLTTPSLGSHTRRLEHALGRQLTTPERIIIRRRWEARSQAYRRVAASQKRPSTLGTAPVWGLWSSSADSE